MKRRKAGGLVLYLLMWLMVSVLIVGSVFVRVTDTDAAHKLTVSVTDDTVDAARLTGELEKDLPEGIKMVKVRPFTYYLFGGDELRRSDVFIISEAEIGDYIDWFAPIPAEFDCEGGYYADGVLMGIPFRLRRPDGSAEEEPRYLFLGRESAHTEDGGSLYLLKQLISGGGV